MKHVAGVLCILCKAAQALTASRNRDDVNSLCVHPIHNLLTRASALQYPKVARELSHLSSPSGEHFSTAICRPNRTSRTFQSSATVASNWCPLLYLCTKRQPFKSPSSVLLCRIFWDDNRWACASMYAFLNLSQRGCVEI